MSDLAQEQPSPCYYQCYCQKIYRSFSGIYLHIKFKHSQLFYKYDVQENLTKTEVNHKCVYRVKDIAACDKMERKTEFQEKGFRKKGRQDDNVQSPVNEQSQRQDVMVQHYEESQESVKKKRKKSAKGKAKNDEQKNQESQVNE